METAAPNDDRDVVLADIANLRDLGGYGTTDGRRVRRGVIYRGAGLQRLAGNDLWTVRALGWRTLIDLRTLPEVQRSGTAPGGELGAEVHHLPMIREVWDRESLDPTIDAARFLADRYRDMLEEGASTIRTAVGLFSQADNLAGVFYCAAGKDRTGVMAAVLLDALGVDHATIAADYHLSKARVDSMRARAKLREQPTTMVAQPETFMAAPAEAMALFLQELTSERDGAPGYLRSIGVPPQELSALRELLTEAA